MTMNVEFYYRKKIPVVILGATGLVGQKFVQLLDGHPWFVIESLVASEKSVGKTYEEATDWQMSIPIPEEIATMRVEPCKPDIDATIAFSALDSSVAWEIEEEFAKVGYAVVSNTSSHRMDPMVPLVIPEVNNRHFKLIENQGYHEHGFIVTNPNCAVIALAMALKPVYDQFGIEAVQVATMQAISGAGNQKEVKLEVDDNIIPFIEEEEEKIEKEPLKILGILTKETFTSAEFSISAQCNRVPVSEGHMENISMKLGEAATKQDIIDLWSNFKGEPQGLQLPTAPQHPIHYFHQDEFPQPKKQRDIEKGMAVSIGRLRECSNFDWKFSILSHNTIRGAAGCAILNAELLVKQGYIYW
ncbi:MAG: Aspartate-semialdehyde dehydrogenase [Chlamydiae bacterium]|nr:Aspartate-semialdehyde dehydrogenase [Chlamydiota bacterium]